MNYTVILTSGIRSLKSVHCCLRVDTCAKFQENHSKFHFVSFFFHLSESRFLSPAISTNSTKTFPSQLRDIMFPACPWSAPGSPPGWSCPNHLNWLRSTQRSNGSTLNPSWMSELLTLSPNPAKEAHFHRLYSQSHSFGHYPEVTTIGESWDVD